MKFCCWTYSMFLYWNAKQMYITHRLCNSRQSTLFVNMPGIKNNCSTNRLNGYRGRIVLYSALIQARWQLCFFFHCGATKPGLKRTWPIVNLKTLHVTKVQSRAPRTVWLVTHAEKIYTWNFVNGSNGNAATTKKVLKVNSTALRYLCQW